MSRVFLFSASSFMGGVVFGSYADMGGTFVVLVFVIGLCYLSLFVFGRYKNRKLFLWLAILTCCFALGDWRISAVNQNSGLSLENKTGERVSVTGRIVEDPEEREGAVCYLLQADDGTKLLIFAPAEPRFRYGDRLLASGLLARPKNFSTAGGTEFDYVAYLAKDDIHYQLFQPELKLLASAPGWSLAGTLYKLKNTFSASLGRSLPEPEAALGLGLLIGGKQGLGDEAAKDFQRAGVSHITVLSGYNITVVSDNVLRALSFLPRLLGLPIALIFVILFVVMTGAAASAVRAAIMVSLIGVARLTGRLYAAGLSLVAAGLVMVIINPRLLAFDVGFQFSFLATIGIILGPIILGRWFKFVPQKFTLRDTLTSTLSAQIFVYPWLVYKMGILSLVSVPANLLILPAVPMTMLFSFIVGLAGLASNSLAIIFAAPAFGLLAYIIKVAEGLASLPLSAFSISQVPLILVAAVYCLLTTLVALRLREYQQEQN